MTNLKDFLTSNTPTDTELTVFRKELRSVSQFLFNKLNELKQSLDNLNNDVNDIKLEARQITVAMPSVYWEVFDKIISIYVMRDELSIPSPDEDDQLQDNILKLFREQAPNLVMGEIVISQFILDAIMDFTLHIARSELTDRLQAAIESGDSEALIQLLKNNTNLNLEAINEPDDDDDDSTH
jgi:hypothetical protein